MSYQVRCKGEIPPCWANVGRKQTSDRPSTAASPRKHGCLATKQRTTTAPRRGSVALDPALGTPSLLAAQPQTGRPLRGT